MPKKAWAGAITLLAASAVISYGLYDLKCLKPEKRLSDLVSEYKWRVDGFIEGWSEYEESFRGSSLSQKNQRVMKLIEAKQAIHDLVASEYKPLEQEYEKYCRFGREVTLVSVHNGFDLVNYKWDEWRRSIEVKYDMKRFSF